MVIKKKDIIYIKKKRNKKKRRKSKKIKTGEQMRFRPLLTNVSQNW